MKDSTKKYIIFIIVAAVIVAGVVFLVKSPGKPGKFDSFALCLKEKGAVFYGAFWCPHCQTQKSMFGKSSRLLPYVECSTPDGKSQLQICVDKTINTYPTWDFPSGERETGEISMERLAEITGCEIPQ